MDTRQKRRDAEKAARQLIADRTALIGELAVAQSERDAAQASIDDARERGRQMVREAEDRAAALVTRAREEADAVDVTYADTHAAAVAGGWSGPDLAQLGFPAPARRSRPRPAPTTHAAAAPGSPDSATIEPERGTDETTGDDEPHQRQDGELTPALTHLA